MTAKQIVIDYLKEHGYDGLAYESACWGCGIDNLLCGIDFSDCVAAKKRMCSECVYKDCLHGKKNGFCFVKASK
jgi:hypothetical protein